MSTIGAVCDSLGKTFLTLLLGNLGATSGLWVNSSPVKVKLIIFPLFPPEGNAILPLTAKAVCVSAKSVSEVFCDTDSESRRFQFDQVTYPRLSQSTGHHTK